MPKFMTKTAKKMGTVVKAALNKLWGRGKKKTKKGGGGGSH